MEKRLRMDQKHSHMVEVFKTSVRTKKQAKGMLTVLSKTYPGFKINFDLHDCDKILRVQGQGIQTQKIRSFINAYGYQCEILN